MSVFSRLQSWLLPADSFPATAVPEMSEPDLRRTIGAADPANPMLRAVLLLAYRAWEAHNAKALSPDLTTEQRHYYAGRAAGVMDIIDRVQMTRADWKRQGGR